MTEVEKYIALKGFQQEWKAMRTSANYRARLNTGYVLRACCTISGRKPWTVVRRFDQFLSAPVTPHWKVLRS